MVGSGPRQVGAIRTSRVVGSEALAAVPGIRTARLPQGKLAVHEEFPEATFDAVEPFLAEDSAAGPGSRSSA